MSNTYTNTDAMIKDAIDAAVSARKLDEESERYAKKAQATPEDAQTTPDQGRSPVDMGRNRSRTARMDRKGK